jgi:hypothetical protein
VTERAPPARLRLLTCIPKLRRPQPRFTNSPTCTSRRADRSSLRILTTGYRTDASWDFNGDGLSGFARSKTPLTRSATAGPYEVTLRVNECVMVTTALPRPDRHSNTTQHGRQSGGTRSSVRKYAGFFLQGSGSRQRVTTSESIGRDHREPLAFQSTVVPATVRTGNCHRSLRLLSTWIAISSPSSQPQPLP